MQCVIHSHAEDVLPYVVSGVPLRPVYHMAGFLGSSVPVFDVAPLYEQANTPIEKRDMLINNIMLGEGLATKFGDGDEGHPQHTVVLMRRHGFTCHADSIEKAVYRGIYTKINAKALTDSLAVRKNFEGAELGAMVFDGGNLGLTEDQTIGSTAMNERFQ